MVCKSYRKVKWKGYGMKNTQIDLLDEPIFSVQIEGGKRQLQTIPEILESLGKTCAVEFPALQKHQSHPWYAFLVQVAVIALYHGSRGSASQDKETWQKLLLNLTDEAKEAWCLVVDDLCKPAFMQPPVPEQTLKAYNKQSTCPDEVDILVTAKNHDVKMSRVVKPSIEHWVYSLIDLQTMEGFLGCGNYGIARMNGGFASRPFVGLAPSVEWQDRFQRDVKVFLHRREEILRDYCYSNNGYSLLWTVPWKGETSLSIQDCEPFFIEICRQIGRASCRERVYTKV